MKKKTFMMALTAVAAFATGCGENDCPLTTNAVARFSFLDSRTHKAVTFKEGVTVAGIAEVNGELIVDTLFNRAEDYMSVPLSYTDKTTYVMHYTELMRDTIEVVHHNIPYVNDAECPAMMFFEVKSIRYTTNALDSVTLVNPKITNEERNNFNIYYRAADAEQ